MGSGNGETVAENGSVPATTSGTSCLVFLGTGCSSAVTNARCFLDPSDPTCPVCFQSLSLPPDLNPNYRCNTSLLIDNSHAGGEQSDILIDVGKIFRDQVLLWFIRHKIPRVDSRLLASQLYQKLELDNWILLSWTLITRKDHTTHFCFPQSLDAIERICAKQALLVGMTHEFDHFKDNEYLVEWSRRKGIPVQLAHDGLKIRIEL